MAVLTDGLVTVILPAYNSENLLAEALHSVLNQTYPEVEIVVVDDGSTDHTLTIAREFALTQTTIRAFHQSNAGPAAARNHGIAEANGEFIAFLDADDLWKPDKLQHQLAVFRANPSLGLVYCLRRGLILDEKGRWVPDEERNRRYAYKHNNGGYHRGQCFRKVITESFIALPSVVIPRCVLDEVGMFDTSLITAEDRHLWARIAHDYPIDYVDEELVIVRRHGSNISWDPTREPQTLDFLRKIADEFPECSLSKRGWMRTAYANTARTSGDDALHAGRMKQARRELWQACRYRPTRLSNWVRLALALLPGALLNTLRKIRRPER